MWGLHSLNLNACCTLLTQIRSTLRPQPTANTPNCTGCVAFNCVISNMSLRSFLMTNIHQLKSSLKPAAPHTQEILLFSGFSTLHGASLVQLQKLLHPNIFTGIVTSWVQIIHRLEVCTDLLSQVVADIGAKLSQGKKRVLVLVTLFVAGLRSFPSCYRHASCKFQHKPPLLTCKQTLGFRPTQPLEGSGCYIKRQFKCGWNSTGHTYQEWLTLQQRLHFVFWQDDGATGERLLQRLPQDL